MNSVGIDISKGKSTVAIIRPFGEVVISPFAVCHTSSELSKLAKLLKKRGFERYEVSNFAVSSFECRHNVNYWTGGDYIGFGLAAHSYNGGRRFANANTFV